MDRPVSFALSTDRRSFRLDPRDPSFFQNPYPLYRTLHEEAPVAFWEEAGCVAVASHALVQSALKDRRCVRVLPEQIGADRLPDHVPHFARIERHSLLELDGPSHTRLRSRLTRAFVARAVEGMTLAIRTLAHDLACGLRDRGGGDLVRELAEPLPVAVIADLIGVDRADAVHLLRWSHAMVAMYQFGRTRETEDRADAAAAEFAAFLLDLIERRRGEPRADLLSALVTAGDDALTDEEVVSLVVLLLNAGHEATVHQIGNGVASLLGSGLSIGSAFGAEVDPDALVEEMLRHDTPLHLFRRVAASELQIGDRTIRRGEEVALLLAAANRDPAVYREPDRFDPERPRVAHTSFGAGVHFCIGAPLARLELRIVFETLRDVVPNLRLTELPRYRDSYHFRGVERLPVTCS